MRLISILCVVLVMALNMMPCADMHETIGSSSIAQFSSNDAHEHTAVEDGCTPFCHCACCAASVVLKLQTGLAVPFSFQREQILVPFSANSVKVSLSVWQPPKLA